MMRRMKIKSWAAITVMAAIACPFWAQAETLKFNFNAPGVTAALAISIMADPNTGVLPTSPPSLPNSFDPIGSYVITAVTGTFSDVGAGITNATVTGVVALNRVAPEPTNLLAPDSFSLFKVKNGVDEGDGIVSPGLHYDNLFYPGGSPRTASDYPFSGGVFDIYGVAFALGDGDTVNLWSNGVKPMIGLNYGVAVTDGIDVLDYTGGVSLSAVPLPGAAPLFGASLIALGAFGYGMKRKGPFAA